MKIINININVDLITRQPTRRRRNKFLIIKYRSKLTMTSIHDAKCESVEEKNINVRHIHKDVLRKSTL
jgi:hypothetical protein